MTGEPRRTIPSRTRTGTRTRTWAARLATLGAACAAAVTLGVGSAAAQPAPAAPTTAGTPCAATAKACMDLSHRQAWLTDGAGHVVAGPFAARGGTDSAPTPVGTFAVEKKAKHYWSTEFDAPMPNSVFFEPGIAFHEDSTSVPSNGCVHLSWSASEQFYDTLQPGDPVQVVA